jgi:hypothetical protein
MTIEQGEQQWAVEAEVYRRGSAVKHRSEFRTFATQDEANAWVKNHEQQWHASQVVVAYLARVCRWNNGQWVPVAVRHSCLRGVLKGNA